MQHNLNVKVSFYDAVIYKDSLYFSNALFNGLFAVDLYTNQVEYICTFDQEKIYEVNLHRKVALFDEKLFFFPFTAQNIAIFDLKTKIMKYLPVHRNALGKTSSIIETSDGFVIFPTFIEDDILYLNKYDFTINHLLNIKEEAKKQKISIMAKSLLQEGPSNFSPVFGICFTDVIGIWNKGKIDFIHTKFNNILEATKADDGNVCLINESDNIVGIYNMQSDELKTFEVQCVESAKRRPFSKIIANDSNVFIIPSYSRSVECIDLKTGDGRIIYEIKEKSLYEFDRFLYEGFKIIDNKLYIWQSNCNESLCVNLTDLSIKEIAISYNSCEKKELMAQNIMSEMFRDNTLIYENNLLTLGCYLNQI